MRHYIEVCPCPMTWPRGHWPMARWDDSHVNPCDGEKKRKSLNVLRQSICGLLRDNQVPKIRAAEWTSISRFMVSSLPFKLHVQLNYNFPSSLNPFAWRRAREMETILVALHLRRQRNIETTRSFGEVPLRIDVIYSGRQILDGIFQTINLHIIIHPYYVRASHEIQSGIEYAKQMERKILHDYQAYIYKKINKRCIINFISPNDFCVRCSSILFHHKATTKAKNVRCWLEGMPHDYLHKMVPCLNLS